MKTTKQARKLPRRVKARYNRKPSKGELNELVSKTKQNESLTIREILNRSIQGIEYTDFKTPYYEDEANLSNYEFNVINNMDMDDKLRMYEEINQKTGELTNSIQKHKKDLEQIQLQQQAETQQRVAPSESIAKAQGNE